ncbi:MAG: NADH-quinone oxidoreductase subunit NuoH [Chloroflexi bacterium]|nr:MAG: NADH-quinone oxidoreductase subunit NuoH [Chloroflexota bacterium]MBL1196253.1 NADH-quinone oxidoreductase subunit NuoH [Chloroflexota bacterium]NOH13548.1 NADH-quinone oxidoreductase subunit NuoH [Chloroflexota bacterium]
MDIAVLIEWIAKSAILIFILLTGFAYTTYYERRLLALIQNRVGPNRAGPFGLLQPVADGVKLIFKEELTPAGAYKAIFLLSPILTMVPALVIMAVVPWGESINLFGREIFLGLTDINVGVLYLLSIASISVYGIVLAGWSSNNKYAMLGGIRSSAQMISYELALGLAFVPSIMMAGSLSLLDIVRQQGDGFYLWSLLGIIEGGQTGGWFIFTIPGLFGAAIFYIAMLAEVNRAPFDMPEAEQELTAGYHTEYSGMKFALFFMGEYIKMIAVSAIFSTLFLGGFSGPGVYESTIPFMGITIGPWPILGPIYLGLKIVASLGLMIWIRATFPRLRYDRLMGFGWKVLLPLALANVFLTAIWVIIFQGFTG